MRATFCRSFSQSLKTGSNVCPTLFMRADMVWRVLQPMLDVWAAEKADFPSYNSGNNDPKAVDELLARGAERARRPLAPASKGKHDGPA